MRGRAKKERVFRHNENILDGDFPRIILSQIRFFGGFFFRAEKSKLKRNGTNRNGAKLSRTKYNESEL